MKTVLIRIAGLLLMMAFCDQDVAHGLPLATNGTALLSITISANASANTKAVAEELKQYLDRMSGASFQIATNGSAGLVLGTLAEFPVPSLNNDLAITNGFVGKEAYAIRTETNRVLLLGATDKGTSHAAFRFLEENGCRWFFPNTNWEVVPFQATLQFNTNITDRPVFLERGIWYAWGFFNDNGHPNSTPEHPRNATTDYVDWARHNRMGGSFISACGHSYGRIASENAAEFAAHPEYWALVGGQRSGPQFELSNPGLRQLVVNWAINYFSNNPTADMISVDPADGGGYSESPESQALGSASDNAFGLANEVARALQVAFPGQNKMVGMYAYNWHSDPPPFALEPNVYVQLTMGYNGGKLTIDELFDQWPLKCRNLGFYDYYSTWLWDWDRWPGGRVGDKNYSINQIHRFQDANVRGGAYATSISAESGNNWGPNGRGYYLANKLMWHPDSNPDAILQDFYDRAFGPAAEAMKRYYSYQDNVPLISPGVYGALFRAVQEASVATIGRPDVQRRLDDIKNYLNYEYLCYRSNRGDDVLLRIWSNVYRARYSYMNHWEALRQNWIHEDTLAAGTPRPWRDDNTPISHAETEALFQEGLNYYPEWVQPAEVSFSTNLVAVNFGGAGIPSSQFYQGPAVYEMISLRGEPLKIKFEAGNLYEYPMTYQVTDTAGHILKEGKPNLGEMMEFEVPVPGPGLYFFNFNDGGNCGERFWKADQIVALPLQKNRPYQAMIHVDPMYFYVPKGTTNVNYYYRRADWQFGGAHQVIDPNGIVVKEVNVHGEYVSFPVPAGTDGKVWSMGGPSFGLGLFYFFNIPNYFSPSPAKMLIPREVAENDNLAIMTGTEPIYPLAPSDLLANAASSNRINLSWTDHAAYETGFVIERKTGSGSYAQIATVGENITRYQDSGLTEGAAYSYRVRAINADGVSAYCNEVTATPSAMKLVAHWRLDEMNGTTASDSSGYGHSGTLVSGPTWISGIFGGAVHFAAGSQCITADNVAVNTSTGGCNTVAFWMKWDGGDSQMPFGWNTGYDLCLLYGSFGINTAQGDLLGIPSAGMAGQWVHVAVVFPNEKPTIANAKMYINGSLKTMTRRLGGSTCRIATPTVIISGWGSEGAYRDNYKFGGTIDDLRIYDKELSAAAVVVLATPAIPAAPSGLSAMPVSINQINLSWTDNATNEAGFAIERKIGNGGTYAQIASVGANVVSFHDTDTTAGTIYYYRVRATSPGGNSGYGNEVQAITSLSGEFTRKLKITFPGYNRSEPLTDFPVLVVLSTNSIAGFRYSDFGSPSDGADLRFISSNGVDELSYEIEKWDPSGSSYVWVKVPRIAGSTDCIYAYWGKSGMSAPSYTTNGTTWASSYAGVWHLNGTGNQMDSGTNRNSGTSMGATRVSGRMAGAAGVNASLGYVNIPHQINQIKLPLTISGWFRSAVLGQGNWESMISKYSLSAWNGWNFDTTSDGYYFYYMRDNANYIYPGGYGSFWGPASTNWVYLAATIDDSGATLYRDGVFVTHTAWTGTPGNASQSADLRLGYITGSAAPYGFNGSVDEFRLAHSSHSSNWVWACWLNQASNEVFNGYGSVVSINPQGPVGTFASWAHKMNITFQGYNRPEVLTNFPVLVVLDPASIPGFQYSDFGSPSDGADLRFCASNGTNELSYEIEKWNPTGRSYVWVNVSTLSGAGDYVYAYWGKSGVSAPAYTTNGSTWNNGYVGVWHLDGTSAQSDSSTNGNSGVNNGAIRVSGYIDGAAGVNASLGFVNIPHQGNQTKLPLTISGWVKSSFLGQGDWMSIINKYPASAWNGWSIDTTSDGYYFYFIRDNANYIYPGGNGIFFGLASTNWIYLTAVIDEAGATLYRDGVSVNHAAWTGSAGDASQPADLRLGYIAGAGGYVGFNGTIDEFSLANSARSSNWVWACWLNQASNGVFNSYGPAQSNTSQVDFSTWSHDMRIAFTGYSRAETLMNFPVLVILNTNRVPGFHYSDFGSPADGSDLRFSSAIGTEELSYEIEKWDTNGSSYVWVKVPTISNSGDYICAHWGKSGVSAPAYTTDGSTWNSGFVGVWHLDGVSAQSDSSTQGNSGINTGAVRVAGCIDGAAGVNASLGYVNIPHQANQANLPLTISAWVRSSFLGQGDWMSMISKYPASSANGWSIDMTSDGYYFYYFQNGANYIYPGGNGELFGAASTNWVYLTAVIDETGATLYRNGIMVNHTSWTGTAGDASQTADLRLGYIARGGYVGFTGSIDEFTLANSARSSNWVWACWLNQASNEVFSSYGPVNLWGVPAGFSSGASVMSSLTSTGASGGEPTGLLTGLPSPWETQDIGPVGMAGSASYSDGLFTIKGAGADIAGAADAFRYMHQLSSGDCELKARVVSVSNTSAAAKAGVMIRESLNANAREAGVWVSPSSGIIFTCRTNSGGTTVTSTSTGKTAPYWVRVLRAGNSFSAYYGTNGTSWTQLGTTRTISMSTNAYMGLGVSSKVTNTLNTATIGNVTATP